MPAKMISDKFTPRRAARSVRITEALDEVDEELLELADGATTLATIRVLLGVSESALRVRIARLSHLGFLDDVVVALRTRELASDTLVDAAPPAFDEQWGRGTDFDE